MSGRKAAAPLAKYRTKRDFARSPEPSGGSPRKPSKALIFVVHRHAAQRLHYDLRLEWAGVLKSWAVTRGPSLDPADKRLAVEVEDHPMEYADFEGVIPKPGYGGGTVQVWDRGLWAPLDADAVADDLARGELKFVVAGERLHGGFVLVRMRTKPGARPDRQNWLLIKERDSAARPGEGDAVLAAATSVKTGRTLEQITNGEAAKAAAPRKPVYAARNGTAPLGFVPPQLCRLVIAPPRGDGWIHELKLDGYRLQAQVTAGRATLRTRTGLDWTTRFPGIAQAALHLPDCVIDGEAVVLNATGQPDFSALQETLAGEREATIVLFAFDLLTAAGSDLRSTPLHCRKDRLKRLLAGKDDRIRYLDHFTAPGDAVLASACRLEVEGIVSKRHDAPYVSGRGDTWRKSKCRGRDEFLVGGWSAERSGHGLGALLVGAMREGRLVYLGRIGSGFSTAAVTRLLAALKPAAAATSPFVGTQPARVAGVTWCRPGLVVEVAYAGWTEGGVLRHASFQGIREDKPAMDVVPPTPAPPPPPRPPGRSKATPALTHPERILWPATDRSPAITKADLVAYYERYADRLLAQVGGRPLSILRAPNGVGAPAFFQRHAMPGQSASIGSVHVAGQAKPYMRVDDLAGLAALAQISAVELHPLGARAESVEVPDRLVFDLDPAEGLDFAAVMAAAHELRARLGALGLTSFAKVTGGKGLHLVVPLAASKRSDAAGWYEAKRFSQLVCALMERDAPEKYTTTMAKKARHGRVFLDYLRNDRLSTAVAAWSLRGRPSAPVARPVAWSTVKTGLQPATWLLTTLRAEPMSRDPWADFGAAASPLRDAVERLTGVTHGDDAPGPRLPGKSRASSRR